MLQRKGFFHYYLIFFFSSGIEDLWSWGKKKQQKNLNASVQIKFVYSLL